MHKRRLGRTRCMITAPSTEVSGIQGTVLGTALIPGRAHAASCLKLTNSNGISRSKALILQKLFVDHGPCVASEGRRRLKKQKNLETTL